MNDIILEDVAISYTFFGGNWTKFLVFMAGDEKVNTGTLMNVSALEELRIFREFGRSR